jgi:hypothetical protein
MDSSIRLPGGFRIGWDGIIGLIPGLGDVAGMGISLYIVAGAWRSGISRATLIQMLLNLGVEAAIGSIPVIGDLFDFAFKANNRNMRLLENHDADPEGSRLNSRLTLVGIILVGVVFAAVVLWLVITVIIVLLNFVS